MNFDPADDQLAPGFLLAPPGLPDPNFEKSVVLLAVNDESGSMGFIINRKADFTLHTLLEDMTMPATVADQPVLLGGPVAGFSGFVIYEHPEGEPRVSGIEITPTLSISASRELLEAAGAGEVDRFDLVLGYAGWGPGQLRNELKRGGWMHAPFSQDLVFDVPIEERWDQAYARLGVSPMRFMNVPGGAQA